MIEHFIHDHDIIMFTVCMDVVDSAFAPGVSAPAVLGIYPHTVFELAKRIIPSEKVASISIAEMNPQYDLRQSHCETCSKLSTSLNLTP